MVQTIFILILIIVVANFIFDRVLSFLNIKHAKQPIPTLLEGIYSEEQYKMQQSYFRANTTFGQITSTYNFLIVLGMYAFGGFGWLDGLLQHHVANPMLISLIFFGVLFLANDIISIPFEWYDTFVIEERFGFNKVTPKLFILDKLKSYLLTVLIGGGILSLIIWIYQLTPTYFWFFAWAAVTLFGLFMSMFYSELIVPLFNKQTLLPEGELRTSIEKFSEQVEFELKNIYVIDGSKRSTKANAYFTGFGKKKRIVLYDTLINDLSIDEIVAVLAHEIGHYKSKHTIKNILLSIPNTLVLFFLFGLILKSNVLARALGGEQANFHLNTLAFGILYSPVSLILDLGMNVISRKFEFQADYFVKQHGRASDLIASLKKISSQSLSNLTPHPAVVFVNYSHPTLLQRIKALL